MEYQKELTHAVLKGVISNDLERHSKIINDTERHAASLQQLSFRV